MERLTERTGEGQAIPRMELRNNGHQKCMERLAEYEDLEEQGKLLKLPCAVGHIVWCLQIHRGGGRVSDWGEIFQSEFSVEMYDDLGKIVFPTREEAEAALKEL